LGLIGVGARQDCEHENLGGQLHPRETIENLRLLKCCFLEFEFEVPPDPLEEERIHFRGQINYRQRSDKIQKLSLGSLWMLFSREHSSPQLLIYFRNLKVA
jgi:hypothetical protein